MILNPIYNHHNYSLDEGGEVLAPAPLRGDGHELRPEGGGAAREGARARPAEVAGLEPREFTKGGLVKGGLAIMI